MEVNMGENQKNGRISAMDRKDKKKGLDLLKEHNYLFPEHFSDKDKFIVSQYLESDTKIYIPIYDTVSDLKDAGYKITKNHCHYQNPKGHFRYTHVRLDGIIAIVAEVVSQDGLLLWCENIKVDYDYAMMMLYKVRPEYYFELRCPTKNRRPIISETGTSKQIHDRLQKLEDRMHRKMWALLSENASALKYQNKIKTMEANIRTASNTILNDPNNDPSAIAMAQGWLNTVSESNKARIHDSKQSFVTFFYTNIKEFPNDDPIIAPEPNVEAQVSYEYATKINNIIQNTINSPSKKNYGPMLDHFWGPSSDCKKSNSKDPEDLKEYKLEYESVKKNGSQLSWLMITKMIESYWTFDLACKTLVRSTASSFEVPTITISYIRDNLHLLEAKGKTRSNPIPPVPKLAHTLIVKTLPEMVMESMKKQLLKEYEDLLMVELQDKGRIFLSIVLAEQKKLDVLCLDYTSFIDSITKSVHLHRSHLFKTNLFSKYDKDLHFMIQANTIGDNLVIKMLKRHSFFKYINLVYIGYLYGAAVCMQSFTNLHSLSLMTAEYSVFCHKTLGNWSRRIIETYDIKELMSAVDVNFKEVPKLTFLQHYQHETDTAKEANNTAKVGDPPKEAFLHIPSRQDLKESDREKTKFNKAWEKARIDEKAETNILNTEYFDSTTSDVVNAVPNLIHSHNKIDARSERVEDDFIVGDSLPSFDDMLTQNLQLWTYSYIDYITTAVKAMKKQSFNYKDFLYASCLKNLLYINLVTRLKHIHFSLFSLWYLYKVTAELMIRSEYFAVNMTMPKRKRELPPSADKNQYLEFAQILSLHQHLLECFLGNATKIHDSKYTASVILKQKDKIEMTYSTFFECLKALDDIYLLAKRYTVSNLKNNRGWEGLYTKIASTILPEASDAFSALTNIEYMSADRKMSFQNVNTIEIRSSLTNNMLVIISCFSNGTLTTNGIFEAFGNLLNVKV